MENTKQYIRYLQVSNVSRIMNVVVEPSSNLVTVAGANGAGKTTLIKSLLAACGGEVPAKRNGEEKATIYAETDEIKIKVEITSKGDTMTVTSKTTGKRINSPKTLLKKLMGKRACDTTLFLCSKAKDQVETLLNVISIPGTIEDVRDICKNVDIELDENETVVDWINGAYKQVYDERQIVNRETKKAQAVHDQYKDVVDAKSVDLEELYKIKDKATSKNNIKLEVERIKVEFDRKQQEIVKKREEFEQQEKEKRVEFERQEKERQDELGIVGTLILEKETTLEELKPYNLEEIVTELAQSTEANRLAALYGEKQKAETVLWNKTKKSTDLTETLQRLEAYKNEQMQQTKMPVDGLDIRGGKIYYQEHPLSDASGAEQMLVATAIAAEEIPVNGLQALFILDPPQLDKQAWSKLEEFADEKEIQLWIAKVEDDPENSTAQIILREGKRC